MSSAQPQPGEQASSISLAILRGLVKTEETTAFRANPQGVVDAANNLFPQGDHFQSAPTKDGNLDCKELSRRLEERPDVEIPLVRTPEGSYPAPTEAQIQAYTARLFSMVSTPVDLKRIEQAVRPIVLVKDPKNKLNGITEFKAQWDERLIQVRNNIAVLYPDNASASASETLQTSEALMRTYFPSLTSPVLAHGNSDILYTAFDKNQTILLDIDEAVVTEEELAKIEAIGNSWARMVERDSYRSADGQYDAAASFLRQWGQQIKTSTKPEEQARNLQLMRIAVAFTSVSLAKYGIEKPDKEAGRARRWLERAPEALRVINEIQGASI